MPAYLTTAEVADLVRTSPETVRYWRFIGKGPASFKLGRKVLYDRAEVQAWIDGERAAQCAGRPGVA
jgi:excisionase family DNA binding protein